MLRKISLSIFASFLLSNLSFCNNISIEKCLEKVNEQERSLANKLIKDHTLKVNLKEDSVKSSIDIYDFLLDRLPFTSNVVHTLGLGSYLIEKDSETLTVDDTKGVKIKMKEIYKHSGLRIYLTDGEYKTPLLPRITGKALIILSYENVKDSIKTKAEIYFRIENEFVNLIKGLILNILKSVIKEKCGLFIYASKSIAELVHSDPKGIFEKIEKGINIRESDLLEFKKRFVESKK